MPMSNRPVSLEALLVLRRAQAIRERSKPKAPTSFARSLLSFRSASRDASESANSDDAVDDMQRAA